MTSAAPDDFRPATRLPPWAPKLEGRRRLRALPCSGFFLGANLPWVEYGCDFGASAWFPQGGLAARTDVRATFEFSLDRLAADGITIVRLFVLCDGRSGIRFDAKGVPTGLDDAFFRDADAVFDAAVWRGIGLVPVLFDFHLCSAPEIASSVVLGGRSSLITDPDRRDALFTRIVVPLVNRYREHPAVLAWDLFNEPEWCIRGIGTPFGTRGIPPEELHAWLRALVACVHSYAPQPVTVGSAGAAYLDFVRGLDLDVYQIHWYERFGWAALADPVERLGLDRPVFLGEFPGRTSAATPAEIVSAARNAGYAGALIWSVLSQDPASAYEALSF